MSDPDALPVGLILAGGGAVRMGGGDKGLLRVGSRTILDRVMGRLAPQCSGLILGANGDPARFAGFGLPVVPDHPEDQGAGPLAGLLAGLDWVAVHRPDVALVLSAPADTPFPPGDLATSLAAARLRAGATVACARSGDRTHPLSGLWPVALRHDLRHVLRAERLRRVTDFLARHAIAWATWPAAPLDPFFNVNTAADLAVADRLARGEP